MYLCRRFSEDQCGILWGNWFLEVTLAHLTAFLHVRCRLDGLNNPRKMELIWEDVMVAVASECGQMCLRCHSHRLFQGPVSRLKWSFTCIAGVLCCSQVIRLIVACHRLVVQKLTMLHRLLGFTAASSLSVVCRWRAHPTPVISQRHPARQSSSQDTASTENSHLSTTGQYLTFWLLLTTDLRDLFIFVIIQHVTLGRYVQ